MCILKNIFSCLIVCCMNCLVLKGIDFFLIVLFWNFVCVFWFEKVGNSFVWLLIVILFELIFCMGMIIFVLVNVWEVMIVKFLFDVVKYVNLLFVWVLWIWIFMLLYFDLMSSFESFCWFVLVKCGNRKVIFVLLMLWLLMYLISFGRRCKVSLMLVIMVKIMILLLMNVFVNGG